MNPSEPIDLSDLQKLQFMPVWAEELKSAEGAAEVVWGKFEPSRGARPEREGRGFDRGGRGDNRGDNRGGPRGDNRGGPRGDNRGGPRPSGPPRGDSRGPRPDGPRGPRPDGPRGPRPEGQGFDNRGPRPEGDRGPRPDGPRGPRPDGPRSPRPEGDRGPRGGGDRGRPPYERRFDDRPPPHPLPGWNTVLVPEPRSLEAIARQIKASGRAFAVFDVGRLFMQSRERYLVRFHRSAGEDDRRSPMELMQVPADNSLWITREEALRHLLHSSAIEKYYAVETLDVEPPKGNFSSIAVCGFSGVLLGPPNHHSFPREVARLHRERFANMPLERYKARVRIEKDEALIQKWMDGCKSQTVWVPLPTTEGAEPEPPLKSFAELEAHFLRNHATWACEPVKEATVPANADPKSLAEPLQRLIRFESERQQRFPMQLVQDLCRLLEGRGLRFFKHDKKATFVCRTRPHFLPDDLQLSERIRSIVEMVRANPGITYSRIVEFLAPHIKLTEATKARVARPTEEAPAAEAPAEAPAAENTTTALPSAEATEAALTETIAPDTTEASVAAEQAEPTEQAEPAEQAEPTEPVAEGETAETVGVKTAAPAPETPSAPALSPQEIAILQDLRWLVQEGFVTEFQSGELHVLGRPAPPPPQPRADRPKKQRPPRPDTPAAEEGGAPEGDSHAAAAVEAAEAGTPAEASSDGESPAAEASQTAEPDSVDSPTGPSPEPSAIQAEAVPHFSAEESAPPSPDGGPNAS